jgi:hypothetical protein
VSVGAVFAAGIRAIGACDDFEGLLHGPVRGEGAVDDLGLPSVLCVCVFTCI